jgi:hypothetical protein
VEEFYCVDDSGNGTVLEACLNYSIILVGGFEHFSTFPDIVRTGFFDVNVLAGLTGPYSGEGVPVVGRGNNYRIYIFVVERSSKVIIGGWSKLLNFADFLYAFREKIFVGVDKSFDANVGNSGKAACKLDASAANTYDGHIDTFICANYARGGRGGKLGMVAGDKRVGGDDAGSQFCGVGEEFAARDLFIFVKNLRSPQTRLKVALFRMIVILFGFVEAVNNDNCGFVFKGV